MIFAESICLNILGMTLLFSLLFFRPLLSLALSALVLKVLFIAIEAFVFGSIPTGQHLIFPLVTGVVSIIVTIALLVLTSNGSSTADDHEDRPELIKKTKRKNHKDK